MRQRLTTVFIWAYRPSSS